MYETLVADLTLGQVIQQSIERGRLDCVPDDHLAGAEVEPVPRRAPARR
jgi:hypothetical protein